MKFTGRLRILNKMQLGVAGMIDLICQIFEDGIVDTDLTEVAVWLETEVNGNAAACKAAQPKLAELIRIHRKALIALAQSSDEGMNAVGYFLSEALRCTNFALHKGSYIKEFIRLIRECGIAITGDPDGCEFNATFGDLTYNASTKTVKMLLTAER